MTGDRAAKTESYEYHLLLVAALLIIWLLSHALPFPEGGLVAWGIADGV